jgi:hypothetical protein
VDLHAFLLYSRQEYRASHIVYAGYDNPVGPAEQAPQKGPVQEAKHFLTDNVAVIGQNQGVSGSHEDLQQFRRRVGEMQMNQVNVPAQDGQAGQQARADGGGRQIQKPAGLYHRNLVNGLPNCFSTRAGNQYDRIHTPFDQSLGKQLDVVFNAPQYRKIVLVNQENPQWFSPPLPFLA